VPIEVLRAESERQASLVLGMALRNRDRLQQIIDDESIDCDFFPRGGIYLAHTDGEEQGMCKEVMLAAQHGQRIELWSRRKIFEEFDIRTDFVGRFIPGDGTYHHPFKYVCGVISAALKSGVELYTRVRVNRIRSISPDRHYVTTDRGRIVARRVIVATNAFTRELLPEMRSISPRQSQIMLTEHALDRARGRIITSEQGPAFFNQPRAGARNGRAPLLFGGGNDRAHRDVFDAQRRDHPRAGVQAVRNPPLRRLPHRPEVPRRVEPGPDQCPPRRRPAAAAAQRHRACGVCGLNARSLIMRTTSRRSPDGAELQR
jgi:glycine/D-amino acid oxidase-like deaminating enzyme